MPIGGGHIVGMPGHFFSPGLLTVWCAVVMEHDAVVSDSAFALGLHSVLPTWWKENKVMHACL